MPQSSLDVLQQISQAPQHQQAGSSLDVLQGLAANSGDTQAAAAQISAHPPGVQAPANPIPTQDSLSERIGDRIKQNAYAIPNALEQAPDAFHQLVHPNHDTSLSGFPSRAAQGIENFVSQYKDPANIAGDVISAGLASTIAEPGQPSSAKPVPRPAPATSSLSVLENIKPMATKAVMKAGAKLIPGVSEAMHFYDLYKTLREVGILGKDDIPPPAPKPVPPQFGKGQFGTPVSEWGKLIPQATAQPESVNGGGSLALQGTEGAFREALTHTTNDQLAKFARKRGIQVEGEDLSRSAEGRFKPVSPRSPLVNKLVEVIPPEEQIEIARTLKFRDYKNAERLQMLTKIAKANE